MSQLCVLSVDRVKQHLERPWVCCWVKSTFLSAAMVQPLGWWTFYSWLTSQKLCSQLYCHLQTDHLTGEPGNVSKFYRCSERNFEPTALFVDLAIPDAAGISEFYGRLLKTHCFQQAYCSPGGSAKCLRFGHWLTLCTLNMHILTYLLT